MHAIAKRFFVLLLTLSVLSGVAWSPDARAAQHTLNVEFASPVAYRTAASGAAGGAIVYTAGLFIVAEFDTDVAGGTVRASYVTDTGDHGYMTFACNPNTQTIVAALQAALNAAFPSNQPTITYN